jgi:hypothetical protein
MTRYLLPLLLVLLVGCAPALAPSLERQNGLVLVSVPANQPVYQATVTILGAVTSDPRCTSIGPDAWCLLGDLAKREVAFVMVAGEPGQVACTAAGFLSEDLALASYRPFACRATP